jgi:predicted RNase H-like nuclease (RuvC/YqgF family)
MAGTESGAPFQRIEELEQEIEGLRDRVEQAEGEIERLRRENERLRTELKADGRAAKQDRVPSHSGRLRPMQAALHLSKYL